MGKKIVAAGRYSPTRAEQACYQPEPHELIDGVKYWLGATYGKYSKEHDCFMLGNCFVARAFTDHRDTPIR